MDNDTFLWSKDGFFISTNKELLNIDVIHRYLNEESYWAKGIRKDLVQKAIENSTYCFGVFEGDPKDEKNGKQIGFARVISDLVRFSHLADVFILKEYRGQGLSKRLISTIVEHPCLAGTAINLATKDAHGLYKQFGFQELTDPHLRMVRPLDWEKLI